MPSPLRFPLTFVLSLATLTVAAGCAVGHEPQDDGSAPTAAKNSEITRCPAGETLVCTNEGPRGSKICTCEAPAGPTPASCTSYQHQVCSAYACECWSNAVCSASTKATPPELARCLPPQFVKYSDSIYTTVWACPGDVTLPADTYSTVFSTLWLKWVPATDWACATGSTARTCDFVPEAHTCMTALPPGWVNVEMYLEGGEIGGGCPGGCAHIPGP